MNFKPLRATANMLLAARMLFWAGNKELELGLLPTLVTGILGTASAVDVGNHARMVDIEVQDSSGRFCKPYAHWARQNEFNAWIIAMGFLAVPSYGWENYIFRNIATLSIMSVVHSVWHRKEEYVFVGGLYDRICNQSWFIYTLQQIILGIESFFIYYPLILSLGAPNPYFIYIIYARLAFEITISLLNNVF